MIYACVKTKIFVLISYVLSPEISIDDSYFTVIHVPTHPIAASVVSMRLFAQRIPVAFFAHTHA